ILHRMLRACFSVDLETLNDHQALKFYFETWLMRLGGYLPDWTSCAICKKGFVADEPGRLLSGFRLACGNCSAGKAGKYVSGTEREILGSVQKIAPGEFVKVANDETVRKVSTIISKLVASHSGREVPLASTAQRSK